MTRQTTKLNRERSEHARAEARILELKREALERSQENDDETE